MDILKKVFRKDEGNNNYKEANEKLSIYTVTSHLGSGTYGNVYRVEETNNPTLQFALKVIPLKSTYHHKLQKVAREVDSLIALKGHPHILTYIYAGVIERWPGPLGVAADIAATQLPIPDTQLLLILTELCSSTLQTKLEEKKNGYRHDRFVEEMMRYAVQLAHALAYIHNRTGNDRKGAGILHRDLAARNIFIGQDGLLVIGDFGLSRFVPENSIRLSSEFARSRSKYVCPDLKTNTCSLGFSKECDVYALGVIFMEMFHPSWLVADNAEDTLDFTHKKALLEGISEGWLQDLITGMVSENRSTRPFADEVLDILKSKTNCVME